MCSNGTFFGKYNVKTTFPKSIYFRTITFHLEFGNPQAVQGDSYNLQFSKEFQNLPQLCYSFKMEFDKSHANKNQNFIFFTGVISRGFVRGVFQSLFYLHQHMHCLSIPTKVITNKYKIQIKHNDHFQQQSLTLPSTHQEPSCSLFLPL